MTGINKVILVGRLGKDPQRKETRDRKEFSVFSMATSKKIKDEERTTWHNVVVWNESSAKYVNSYACTGTLIYVEGELEVRTYDKEGQTHYVTEVIVGQYNGNVQILKDGVSREESARNHGSTVTKTKTYREESGGGRDPLDDEIPFAPEVR
jgi:single-strand DNA-binding protein